MATRATITFMTRYGLGFVARFHFGDSVVDPNDPAIQAVVAAVNLACAAKGVSIELSRVKDFATTAGSGVSIAEDKAFLIVPDDSGEHHILKLPAPKFGGATSVFEGDNATLDLADPLVIAMSLALSTHGRGRSGDQLQAIRKGHRAGGKPLAH